MKFTRANIYGFGKWVDKEVVFNQTELNVIYGENESGKTTLQQFIMFILFGLTSKEQTFYQPIESGKFGGILTFLDEQKEEVTIERTSDSLTIYSNQETSHKEEVLAHYLKGLTKQTFMSIYSFSAIDLLHIRNITEQEFGNILFNVGLAGATNIEIAERNIERETGKIFKKAGRIPSLNQELQKLDELAIIERKLKNQESLYAKLKSEQQAGKEKLESYLKDIREARHQLDQYKKQLHLLPTINDLKQSKEELKKLPEKIEFPESGIDRLEKNKEALVPLLSNQANIEKNISTYQNDLNELKKSILADDTYKLANELLKERNDYKNQLATSDELTKNIEKSVSEINITLNDLAIPLNITTLKNLNLPYYLAKTWQTLEEEAYQLNQIKKEIEAERLLLEGELETIQTNINQLKQKLLATSELDKLKEHLFNYSHTAQQVNELNSHKENESIKKKVLFGGISLLAILIVLSIITTNLFFVIGTIVSGIILFVLYYVINYFEMKNQNLIDSLVSNQSSNITKSEYIQMKNQVDKQDDYLIQLKYLENDQQKINREELQISERFEMFTQREDIFKQRVINEQKEYEFLENIEPIHWPELLTTLKKLKEVESFQDEKELKNKQIIGELTVYEEKLSRILDRLSLTTYEELTSQVDAHNKAEQLINNYEKIIEELTEEKALLTEKINYYQAEISTLFKLASVENEEAFHRTYYNSEEKKRLKEQIESYYNQLKMSFDIENLDYLLTINQDEYDLNQKIDKYKEQIKKADEEINNIREKIATLDAEIKQMEETEEYSDVLHKMSYKKAKAKELAFEWSAMKLATDTLEQTKRSFHQKYMKDVIEKASYYFEIITKSKYVAIFPPEKNKTFSVETNLHTRFTINQLSQGTIDQLYVSLRIAISTVMSEKYSVPFIIDDAFVHFDHKREQAVMRLLEEITKEQQVVLFTCKKHLLELTDVEIHYLSGAKM